MKSRRKKCRNPDCREWFQPFNSLDRACSVPCAIVVGNMDEAKRQRKENKRAKEKLKTRREYLKEAQAAFNAYIRMRDRDLPCVSCGRWHQGQWHASHYRSVGACSSLRFDEDNVHKACSPCNAHLSGNIVEYRIGLLRRIGEERVNRLESAPKHYRWTKEQAIEIRDRYRRIVREMKKEKAA